MVKETMVRPGSCGSMMPKNVVEFECASKVETQAKARLRCVEGCKNEVTVRFSGFVAQPAKA